MEFVKYKTEFVLSDIDKNMAESFAKAWHDYLMNSRPYSRIAVDPKKTLDNYKQVCYN